MPPIFLCLLFFSLSFPTYSNSPSKTFNPLNRQLSEIQTQKNHLSQAHHFLEKIISLKRPSAKLPPDYIQYLSNHASTLVRNTPLRTKLYSSININKLFSIADINQFVKDGNLTKKESLKLKEIMLRIKARNSIGKYELGRVLSIYGSSKGKFRILLNNLVSIPVNNLKLELLESIGKPGSIFQKEFIHLALKERKLKLTSSKNYLPLKDRYLASAKSRPRSFFGKKKFSSKEDCLKKYTAFIQYSLLNKCKINSKQYELTLLKQKKIKKAVQKICRKFSCQHNDTIHNYSCAHQFGQFIQEQLDHNNDQLIPPLNNCSLNKLALKKIFQQTEDHGIRPALNNCKTVTAEKKLPQKSYKKCHLQVRCLEANILSSYITNGIQKALQLSPESGTLQVNCQVDKNLACHKVSTYQCSLQKVTI